MDRGLRNTRHVHALTAAGELLRDHPGVLPVLDAHGIVFCAGCYLALMDPISDVVGYHAVHDPDAFAQDLERAIQEEEAARRRPLDWTVDPTSQSDLADWERDTGTLSGLGAFLESSGSGWVLLRAPVAEPLEARLSSLVIAAAQAVARTRRAAAVRVRTLHYERTSEETGRPADRRTAAEYRIRGVLDGERMEALRVVVRVTKDEQLACLARVDLVPAALESDVPVGQGCPERASVR